jgi:hypothetical protein
VFGNTPIDVVKTRMQVWLMIFQTANKKCNIEYNKTF